MIWTELKKIKAVVLDVDGVLTDASVLVNELGEQWRAFNTKDGFILQYAVKKGIHVFVITGGKSIGVQKRLEGLGVKEVHLNISNKIEVLNQLAVKYAITLDEMMYVGDDVPDLECMSAVGLAACPSDAVDEVKRASAYVSPLAGGRGAVRDIFEKLLKTQDKWVFDYTTKSV